VAVVSPFKQLPVRMDSRAVGPHEVGPP
jgi:hypothetical protein